MYECPAVTNPRVFAGEGFAQRYAPVYCVSVCVCVQVVCWNNAGEQISLRIKQRYVRAILRQVSLDMHISGDGDYVTLHVVD